MNNYILKIWYNESNKFQKWWFQGKNNNKSIQIIKNAIINIESKYPIHTIDYWKKNPINCLEGILLFDQFYRHIQQNTSNHEKIATELVFYGIQKNWIPNEIHYLVFFLMPLRHINDKTCHDYCIMQIKKKSSENEYYNKFLNATLKNYSNNEIYYKDTSWLTYIDKYRDILCDNINYEYNNDNQWFYNSTAWKCFINFASKTSLPIIISLSGGVDSMVFLYFCIIYKNINKDFKFGVVHINWNQRMESTTEANFLISYMEKLKITYLYENIENINRKEDREKFEKESRKIRFDIYQKALKKWNAECVFLGHHKGDMVENVFTNMINGKHITNLAKMKKEIIIENIKIVRPFLDIDKDSIYDIAKKCLIPFFKNTTPTWSNRGAIRNKIFPSIEEQFGKRYKNSFLEMSSKIEMMNNMLLKYLINPYLDQIEKVSSTEYSLPFEEIYPYTFYEIMFEKFIYSIGIQKISNKSLRGWYDVINKKKDWKKYILNKKILLIHNVNTISLKIEYI